MSNVTAIYQWKCAQAYERDGFQNVGNALKQTAGRFEVFTDALQFSRGQVAAKADVSTAPVKLYALAVSSPTGATTPAYIQMFNAVGAGATLGTTSPEYQMRCDPGESRNVLFANGLPFATAMSWAATTTAGGATAVSGANIPNVYLEYR